MQRTERDQDSPVQLRILPDPGIPLVSPNERPGAYGLRSAAVIHRQAKPSRKAMECTAQRYAAKRADFNGGARLLWLRNEPRESKSRDRIVNGERSSRMGGVTVWL